MYRVDLGLQEYISLPSIRWAVFKLLNVQLWDAYGELSEGLR